MVTCRFILNLMVIMGFMLNYALRVNLTIAIVDMVQPALVSSNGHHSIENATAAAIAATNDHTGDSQEQQSAKFQWSAYEQNIILGCFFWGYILTELPGGRLAELIGGRRVFGHSMLWASVLTLLTPAAAILDYKALVLIRVLLGFMLGKFNDFFKSIVTRDYFMNTNDIAICFIIIIIT